MIIPIHAGSSLSRDLFQDLSDPKFFNNRTIDFRADNLLIALSGEAKTCRA